MQISAGLDIVRSRLCCVPIICAFDFLRSRCQLELTPTERGAAVKLNFRAAGKLLAFVFFGKQEKTVGGGMLIKIGW